MEPKSLRENFTVDEIEKRIVKLHSHNVLGTETIVNKCMKFGGKGVVRIMILLHNCLPYTPGRRRAGLVVNLLKNEDKINLL